MARMASEKPLKSKRGIPEVREFVSEFVLPIYQFCYYLSREDASAEEVVLEVFREFGQSYRSLLHRGHHAFEPLEMKVELFQIAWRKIRAYTDNFAVEWTMGRDTRNYQDFDSDLFRRPVSEMVNEMAGPEKSETAKLVIARLRKIDFEFRAPVVLRDLIGLGDEEIARVLSLRWGVYRHRLHRGRCDLVQELHGREMVSLRSNGASERRGREI